MPRTRVGDVELDFETLGAPDARPLVLIMGLGSQRVRWPDAWLRDLAARGHRVVWFDNRDVGASTHLSDRGMPNLAEIFAAAQSGGEIPVPYTLDDMADDVAGLLDALELESAHVAGVSMGGAIAQVLALRHPERVRSLVSIMSTTGARDLPPATPEAMAALMEPPPAERSAYIDYSVRTFRAIAGEVFDEATERALAARVFERGIDPAGTARQLAAMASAPSRRERLAHVRVPSLVLHGERDPLLPLAHGEDTARHLPAAEWMPLPRLGHWMPSFHRPDVLDAITKVTERGEAAAAAR